ncbi:MAG: hypothetical protein LBO79_00900 [Zoogloeaceae bacterium]|jgi:hypothetical protein|nr:hypothetical protein [Zoogloeaceae bacterium]
MPELPKSYLPVEEREALLREGGMNLVYLAESQEASHAGDEETSWAWLRYADLPPYALKTMKNVLGADFVRKQDFLCIGEANRVYGENWLDA